MRSLNRIMNALDTQNRTLIVTPHRMYTALLPAVYPDLDKYLMPWRKFNLAYVDLITESPVIAKGSCCDNGRFIFRSCKNFWYMCKQWGLNNYTTWLRYGEDGYPMPTGTTHQARCSYSPDRRLCPVPNADCDYRREPTNAIIDTKTYVPVASKSTDRGSSFDMLHHLFRQDGKWMR